MNLTTLSSVRFGLLAPQFEQQLAQRPRVDIPANTPHHPELIEFTEMFAQTQHLPAPKTSMGETARMILAQGHVTLFEMGLAEVTSPAEVAQVIADLQALPYEVDHALSEVALDHHARLFVEA